MRGGLCEGVDADVVTFLHVGLLDCWVVGWMGGWSVVRSTAMCITTVTIFFGFSEPLQSTILHSTYHAPTNCPQNKLQA